MQKFLQKLEGVSQALLDPLSYLTAAGLLLVVGALLTSSPLRQLLPVLNWTPIRLAGGLLYNSMMVIVNNLSIFLCVGIAAARTRTEKQEAALLALMAYLVFLTANHTTLEILGRLAEADGLTGLAATGQTSILGIQVMDTGVTGGILLGFAAAKIFDRTCETQFTGLVTQVYSGLRWSFLCIAAFAAVFGMAVCFVWPPLQEGIRAMTGWIAASGYAGIFLYGFLERLLIPTGLHHLIYMPFQFSALGGSMTVGSVTYTGAYMVTMAEYSYGLPLTDDVVWMYTGFTKTFGYLGIAAAFILTAKKERRKRTAAAILPLAVTASLASITEPVDFLLRLARAVGAPCGPCRRLYGPVECAAGPGVHLQPAGFVGVQPERRPAADASRPAALPAGRSGDPDLCGGLFGHHPCVRPAYARPGTGAGNSRAADRPGRHPAASGGAGRAGEHLHGGQLLHPAAHHRERSRPAGYGGAAGHAP